MKTSLVIAASLALAAAQLSFAQQSREPPNAQTSPALTVSDSDLETFASIYVDLLDTASKFDAEIKGAQSEAHAAEIKGRAQDESIAKVEQHGWTPQKFNSVSEAINKDPVLTDKAVKLIEAQ